MRFGILNLFCAICGKAFRWDQSKCRHYHSKEWGVLCSKECYDVGELKYARMILGKDDAE